MEISNRKLTFPSKSLVVVVFMLFVFLTSGWIKHGVDVRGIYQGCPVTEAGSFQTIDDLIAAETATCDDSAPKSASPIFILLNGGFYSDIQVNAVAVVLLGIIVLVLFSIYPKSVDAQAARISDKLVMPIKNILPAVNQKEKLAIHIEEQQNDKQVNFFMNNRLTKAIIHTIKLIISLPMAIINLVDLLVRSPRVTIGMIVIMACFVSLFNIKVGNDGVAFIDEISSDNFKLREASPGEEGIFIIGGISFLTILLGAAYIVGNEKPRVALYSALILSASIALLPFFWMVSTSFMSLNETLTKRWLPREIVFSDAPLLNSEHDGNLLDSDDIMLPFNVNLVMKLPGNYEVPLPANYINAWNDANYAKFFANSVIITSISIVGLLTMSILSGYAFARIDFFGRNVMFTLLLATLMIPTSVIMIPNFLTVRGSTFPLPTYSIQFDNLMPTGIEGSWQAGNSWLNTLYALTVPFMGSAFSIFLLRQFFSQIPDELWDAARIDGSGHLRFLVQICLPISRPAIFTVTLLTFIQSWNAFLWPLIVTTKDNWRPIMVGLYNFVNNEAGTENNLMMAGAVITIAPMIILYFFTQKSFTEGIATSGLKG